MKLRIVNRFGACWPARTVEADSGGYYCIKPPFQRARSFVFATTVLFGKKMNKNTEFHLNFLKQSFILVLNGMNAKLAALVRFAFHYHFNINPFPYKPGFYVFAVQSFEKTVGKR